METKVDKIRRLRKESPLHIKDGVLVFSGTATGDIMETVKQHRKERLKKAALQIKR